MVGQQQVSFTERCPLFRGHSIHKVLWWDTNKCPSQRGVLYSEVIQYTKYYGGTSIHKVLQRTMVEQQQVSFTERCPLFRGHLIHKVLWWDSNKCPLQRGVLYSEVIQYTKYYGGIPTSVLHREVSFIQRSFNTQSTMVGQQQVSFTERCPLFRGHSIHKVLWWDSNKCPLQRGVLWGGITSHFLPNFSFMIDL